MREDIFLIEAVLGSLKENDLTAREKSGRRSRQLNAADGENAAAAAWRCRHGIVGKPRKRQQDAVWTRSVERCRDRQSVIRLRRVVSAGMPGVAAADAADAFPGSDDRAVFPHRANEIAAAARLKSALPAENRTERPLVDADEQNQHQRQPVAGSSPVQRAGLVGGGRGLSGVASVIPCSALRARGRRSCGSPALPSIPAGHVPRA